MITRGVGPRLLETIIIILLIEIKVMFGETFTVGYLTADYSSSFKQNKQARVISGAMTLAVREINNDSSILSGHRLEFIWSDTNLDTLNGTRELTLQWRRGAIAFFGPEDSCNVEARVAASWNLPMISYKCTDHVVSDKALYPTFARTSPTATQVTKSIIALLKHFNWHKFSMVVGSDPKRQPTAKSLQDLSLEHNMTVNGRFDFEEPYFSLKSKPFPGIVEDSYIDTRVYVFLGHHNAMVDFMDSLGDKGLIATGEYMVIFPDLTDSTADGLKYFRSSDDLRGYRNVKAAQALLVLVLSPPNDHDGKYASFEDTVDDLNKKAPFYFLHPLPWKKKITVYAAYLYNAVFLYARALNQTLAEGGNPRDGAAIINKIKGTMYRSIQGFEEYIDENGDAEGNYSLLSRQPFETLASNYSMLPVGHFEISENHSNHLPVFKLFHDQSVQWVGSGPPLAEPVCGYRGEKCIPAPTYTLEIVCGLLGGLLFIAAIVISVIYRNWRYEQEIAGLLWRIQFDEVQGLNESTTGSKMTLNTQGSYDSRMSMAQIFTLTGGFKGQVVALKKITKRHIEITRSMKKEMKMMRDLKHDNVNTFHGACMDTSHVILVTEYCGKGSLQDILENDDVKLDDMFVASLVMDLIKGMIFLHEGELHTHGNLKSSNCVVNSRWTLQVADYGLPELRQTSQEDDEHIKYRNRLWTAPELLRMSDPPRRGTQKGDVYSFAIILSEILGRAGPYGDMCFSPKEIIQHVISDKEGTFRPRLTFTYPRYVTNTLKDCWSEIPEARPDFRAIRSKLKPITKGMKRNIFDNMMAMMEKYQGHLEDLVADRTDQLMDEKKKTEGLVHRMLPKMVADQLISGESVSPEVYPAVSIYFSDICGFTSLSAESTPMQVVDLLNDLYTLFDSIIRNYDVYKVETIGDAYMVTSGLPIQNGDNHAGEIASMSLHLLTAIKNFEIRHRPNETMKLRIGIHSGPVVAGVVGLTMPRYCLFGDTVNTSSRMESNGIPLKIHVSNECKDILDKLGGYKLEPRGYVPMKGKGDVFTYWLEDEDTSVRMSRIHGNKFTQAQPHTDSLTTAGDIRGRGLQRHSFKDRDRKSSADNTTTFIELMRDTETSSSFRSKMKRTASLGPKRSSMNRGHDNHGAARDASNTNGHCGVAVGSGTGSCASPRVEKTLMKLPSIVVDATDGEQTPLELAAETDLLLDSGVVTDCCAPVPDNCPSTGVLIDACYTSDNQVVPPHDLCNDVFVQENTSSPEVRVV